MTPLPKLEELLSRVREATGPDRELDDDVLFATGHRFSLAFLSNTGWSWEGADLPSRDIPISASLDAALSLMERVLPDTLTAVCDFRSDDPARRHMAGLRSTTLDVDAYGATRPLALLAAFLTALISETADA